MHPWESYRSLCLPEGINGERVSSSAQTAISFSPSRRREVTSMEKETYPPLCVPAFSPFT